MILNTVKTGWWHDANQVAKFWILLEKRLKSWLAHSGGLVLNLFYFLYLRNEFGGKMSWFSYYHYYLFVSGIEVLYSCLIYWFNILIETLAMLFRAYPCARGIKSTTSYIFHDAMDVSLVWVMLSKASSLQFHHFFLFCISLLFLHGLMGILRLLCTIHYCFLQANIWVSTSVVPCEATSWI